MCIRRTAATSDDRYWVAFSLVPGIGPARLERLLDAYGEVEAAWRAPLRRLAAVVGTRAARGVVDARARLDLEDHMARVRRSGARVVSWRSDEYPERLRSVTSSPFVLYVLGDCQLLAAPSVAIVGTRAATAYGVRAARWLSSDLARSGLVIVSGMAVGIDAVAHQAALDAGGATVAVLGCGIDVTYPRSNARLARSIAARGALVTEYAPGTRPAKGHFPARNRIVSGLALLTAVVEAGTGSGALITARLALDQGRDVWAVPGSVFSAKSTGCHELIASGAGVVRSTLDVLRALDMQADGIPAAPARPRPTDATQAAILDQLAGEPLHVDELCRATGLAAHEIVRALTLMELSNMVLHVGQMKWVAAS